MTLKQDHKTLDLLMNVSLGTGFFMLAIKMYALWATGSAAILSDAAESVVHVVAVVFAAWSLRLARRRSDTSHPFGYDRISFFSAGFEGAMIILAAGYIIYEAVRKFIDGPRLQEIGLGTSVEALVVVLNGVLGLTLISFGKRKGSLIVEANGRHVLTDSVTSLGVLIGLLLVLFGQNPWFDSVYFDPIFAILAALNILKEGLSLVFRSFHGLMDQVETDVEKQLEAILHEACRERGVTMHQLRVRNSGERYWFQFHLVYPDNVLLSEAHRKATEIERLLDQAWPGAVTTTHLETQGDHDAVHSPSAEGPA
jgi:cation diffusion facilitator family transporter